MSNSLAPKRGRSNREKSNVRDETLTLIKALTSKDNVLVIPTEFIRYTGSHDAALFLNQVLYWTDRATMPEGWFWKTYDEWEQEIFLSEYQVRKAAKLLEGKGVLETKVKKAMGSPTVHYRLDEEKFAASFLEFLKNQSPSGSRIESEESEESLTETTSETSPESTPEITSRFTAARPLRAVAEGVEEGYESEREDTPSRYTAGGGSVACESESVVALDAFESVGVTGYGVTMKDERTRDEAKFQELTARELRNRLPDYLAANAARPESFIVRPRGTPLIQVDDLNPAALSRIEPFSFLTVETSAGNYQAWVALDGADEETRSSVRRRLLWGVGGDAGATGAMRLCGSVNRKPERNGFRVRVRQASLSKKVTVSQLREAGLLADEPVAAARTVLKKPTGKPYKFPIYDRCLADKDWDRSRADASFLAICRERGFPLEEAVGELEKISERVQDETVRGRGKEYLRLTARRIYGAA